MATTYTDQYLTRIREGATYTPASQTPAARTFNQKLEPYSMDIGSLYRQLDINASGPFAERNEYKSDLINYIKGTLLQTASEGKVLEYEDKVRDAILIASFTGRDVQTDVLPNFDKYAKQFTGIDTDKNVLKSFQDYFEANSIQKQISNLTMMLTNIPYDDERRPSYEAMLEKARTDYATKTADVSTKSDFWRQVAASGNIVAQSVEQMSRVMSTQIMAYMLTGGLSLASPAVSGIQNITNAARVGSAMKLAGTASAVHYTATTMMKAEAAEIASTLMDMVDENGNRIPLDIIRDNAYRWGITSALVEMGDDFITPIGNVKLGTKTIGEAFSALKGLLQRNPIGYVGLFAGSTALQTTQEGIQGAIRRKGINDAIRQSNAQGFTSFKEDQVQDSASEYWNTAWDEFKESFIPMAATQLLTGGLTFATAKLSQRMQITPQMKKDAAKYFNAKQGQIFDIGYIDTVGEQPVNIYAPKEGAEKQEQAKASPILMTVNKQTGALVPVYRRDRQYAEYLRSNGVTAIRGIVISDDFVSKVGNTASANNLASILGVRIGEQYPVMGYDGDTIIMDTQEGVDAAAADIESLKADIFGNPEVVNLEKQENGNYRLMWETDSGRERSVTIRAKNDTDEMRTTTGEGETAQTTGNVNPIRRMDTSSMEGLFNSSIRKSKDQTLEDAEVEGAAKYFYSQITGMTLDEVEAAWKDDYQAIMERMPAGVDENTIEQGARFMPLLSAITGRTTEDLLNDPKNKISLVYGGKAQIARYKNGRAGYVEGSMRTHYDKDTGVTTYEIRITDIAKDSGTALVHELMHIARAMASEERLSGFVGLKGYTSKYGGMWRSDIKETKDGRYRLGARLFDTYEEAAALVEGNEERFVQDFFEYLKTGEAPNAEVASFFGALKRFLQNFRSAFEKEFSEETKAAFDKLLSGEVTVQPNQTLDEAVEASDATLTDMFDLQDTEAADDFAGLATNYVDDADMYDEQGNPQYSLQNNYLWQVMDANTQRRIDADYERTYNEYHGTDKWMKAPNGQPTNLTERQWVQVRTPAFKEWFGDWENDPENSSKVLDENGEPRVVHHGTPFYGFDTFDTMYDWAWFSATPEFAEGYADQRYQFRVDSGDYEAQDLKKGVYDVFLNIRNPIDLRDVEASDNFTLKGLAEKLNQATGSNDFNAEMLGEDIWGPESEEALYEIWVEKPDFVYIASRNAVRDGRQAYDGVIVKEDSFNGDLTWGVWHPNQIKSATKNIGTFSRVNDSILFSIAPPVESTEFKNWFGGSKVVDKKGNPLILYHGTSEDFQTFDLGKANPRGEYGRGIYLSYKGVAEEYGRWQLGLYASLQNPFVDYFPGDDTTLKEYKLSDIKPVLDLLHDRKQLTDYGYQSLLEESRSPAQLITMADDNSDIMDKYRKWSPDLQDTPYRFKYGARREAITQALKDLGYDGIIGYLRDRDTTQFVAFRSNQVKSVNNTGAFSQSNDNILYSIAPPVDSQEFHDWFDGSAVVDVNGDPLVVYHGSPIRGIEEFNTENRSNGGEGLIYATDNYPTADTFSLEFTEGPSAFRNRPTGNRGQVYALYMSMKHPLDLTNLTEQDKAAIIEAGKKAWPGVNVEKNLEDYRKYGNDQGIKALAWPLIQDLPAHGYDGIIARMYSTYQTQEAENRMPDAIEYGVVSPDQVKQIPGADLYSLAYHGSAADFDRFDLSFIGTGENAQAFGWGAYVTESSGIGKSYAKADQTRKAGLFKDSKFAKDVIESNRKRIKDLEYMIPLLQQMEDNPIQADFIKDLRRLAYEEFLKGNITSTGRDYFNRGWLSSKDEVLKEVNNAIRLDTEEIKKIEKSLNAHRNLYKVEIPDDPGKTQTARMLAEFKQDLANHKEALKDRLEERENVEKKTGPYWEGFIGALRSRKLTDEELKKEIHDRKIALNKEIRWAKSRIESLETHWIPTYEEFVKKELDNSWRIGKYLDWDEELETDEIERIANAMADEYEGTIHIEDAMDRSDYYRWNGEELYGYMMRFYEDMEDASGKSPDQLASELLHKLGYTGIRYEAERHSRKPGQKARYYNYVIFDENDIKILNHWTYDTDAEGAPLFSLSPARQAEVLQARKSEIENAVNAGIFVSTEYLEEFRGEAWADAELEIRDWIIANPDIVSLARSSDSLQEFKDRYLKKNRKQEPVQQDLDFDDIPFDEPEGFEQELSETETEPQPEAEDALSDTWFEKIYGYAHAQSLADRDRQFAAEWTSSEDKTLELAKALRGYMDAIFNPRSKSRSGGYWTTKYVYNSFKGVSNKVRMLQDGKKYNQERSSSAEIQEAQKLIRQNPRPYRNAYQLAMMGESRADEARSGQNVGMAADWMRLEAIDDDIAQEMERLEAEEERTRRLKTDYKAKYEDIKQKLRDAEKDLAKYQESARSKMSDLSDYLTIARRRIDELNAQIKENEADMKSAEREYSKLIERLGGKIENLQEQNAELRGYRQQAKQLEKQLQDRRARVEELRSQLTDAHKEERRLNNALNALRRWKEAKEAADYRKKRIRQIQRLANFNPGSVDASFEESLMWISNLFERDEEVMAERKSIDERIADLKAQIDTARSQGKDVEQMQQNLLQLRKQKKESRKLLPPAQLAIYLPADYMVRADNRQSAWTAEELDVLLEAVKKMRADAKQMLEQKENARMSRLMGFAYGYFQQAVGRPAARNLEGEMSSYSLGKDIAESLPEGKDTGILNTFRFWNAKLQRLARRLDGNKEGLLYDWFVRENYRHQAEELEAIRKRLEAGEAKWKELGLKGSDLAKEGYTGTKQNGTEYSLTRGQMLGVYIYSKSELGMEKLTHYNGNDFTEADIKNIVSELTPTEIEWADYMMADMQANYNRLAEVYYRGWNMNLGQRENYFTLVPSDAATESQLADGIDPQGDLVGKDNKAYVNKDFTKNVNPNAIYPLDLDVTRTWNWQVRKQEHFIAYGEWAKDSQYLFDSKGGQIYKVMERTADLTQAKYFKKIVDNVIGSQQTQNDFDKSYTKWLARRNSAVLIGNTGTMLKQGPSWFAAFNGDVDVTEAMKNAVAINATFRNFLTEHPEIASEFSDVDKAYDFIWANAPEMKDRQIDMDIMEQLNRMDGNKFTYLFNPANRAISKWTMGLVDKLVVNNLWMSRYYTVFNQQKKDGKTDMQAHKEAAFKASQFISETQPTSMRMDQSASQIDAKSSAFLRSIMVFTNQVVNTYNQLWLDVPLAIRQKNAKKAIATFASSIFMISLAAVLSGKFVKRGDEDGKEYAMRFLRELASTAISASAPGFGSIVAAGLEYDSDYSTYIFGLDTIGGALKTVLTPSKRKTVLERMGSVLEDLGVEAGYAIGAPVTPVKNIIKGIKNENPAYLLNGAWGQIVESYK